MAKVQPSIVIDTISGKLNRRDRIVLRTRNGRTHAYALENPFRGTASAAQGQNRSGFGEAVRQASVILKDEVLRAEWEERFREYRRQDQVSASGKYYSTLRGFIIAKLNAEMKREG